MKIKDRFKQLEDSLTLTDYLFFVFLLLFSVSSFISIIANIATKFPLIANLKWLFAIGASLVGLFLIKRNKFIEGYKIIIYISVLAIVIIPSWFYGGGDNTITLLYLFLLAIVSLLMLEKTYLKIIIVLLTSLSCVALIFIEKNYPNIIQASNVNQNVFADKILQIIIIFLLAIILVGIFVKKYKKQNELLKKLNAELARAASVDVLAEVFSRRKILELLYNNLNRHDTKEMYVFMLDIDYFKDVNDKYGHLAGDKIIRYFANHLKKCVGNYGEIGRYGGDEFLIFCSDVDQFKIKAIASELVNIEPFDDIGLSTSGGVMKKEEFHNIDTFVHDADKLLFKAKKWGRAKIVLWDDTIIGSTKTEQFIISK